MKLFCVIMKYILFLKGMKVMNFKKLIVTCVLIFSMFSVNAYAQTMQFTIDNNVAYTDTGRITSYKMEVNPYILDGRTMVPARIIGETFGADVQWVAAEKKVVISLNGKNISMIIGQPYAMVDGQKVELDVAPVIKNDKTMVPLRFVSETLGLDVQYIPSTKQILITDDPAVLEFNDSVVSLSDFKAMYKINEYSYQGYFTNPEELISVTKMMLMDYAVYESLGKSLNFSVDPGSYPSIQMAAEEYSMYFENVLDASWASLLEKNEMAALVNTFLNLVHEPDEATLEAYRQNELAGYMGAKHILVSDEKLAKDILKQLKNGEDFDLMMANYTEDTASLQYPDGYMFTTGEMVAEFENATKKLKVGQLSDVVKSEHGYHIIKRVELTDDYVKQEYIESMVAEYLNEYAAQSTTKVDAYTTQQLIELCK